MIRTVRFYVVLLVSSFIHATTALVAGLVGVKRRPGGIYDWSTNDWSRDLLEAAGTPVRAEGLERIPVGRPVVYASNHSSMFDIWALAATLPGSVRFVAKQELARIPLLGRAMIRAGHIMIDRPNPRRALEAYARAGAVIRSGVSAVVFPEGTRSRSGEQLPRAATRPLREDHGRDAAADDRPGAGVRLERAPRVRPVDHDVPRPNHRPTEEGNARELLLRHEAHRAGERRGERPDVEHRGMVRRIHDRPADWDSLEAFGAHRRARRLEQVARPVVGAPIVDPAGAPLHTHQAGHERGRGVDKARDEQDDVEADGPDHRAEK